MIDRINSLLLELSSYHRGKDDILYQAVSKRLSKSLETYDYELSRSVNYLASRRPDKLMRKLNRNDITNK